VGNGVHTVGVVRGNQWLLRNRNSTGNPDISFTFGQPGDIPVVGDWDGDGRDGIGVVRGSRWILRNTATPGPAHHEVDFAWRKRRFVNHQVLKAKLDEVAHRLCH